MVVTETLLLDLPLTLTRPIPTTHRREARRLKSSQTIPSLTRRPAIPPQSHIPIGFFDDMRPARIKEDSGSNVGRRSSISRHVKVAASRMPKSLRIPRIQSDRLPKNTYSSGAREESRLNNYRQYQANGIEVVTPDQQSRATDEQTMEGAILVRRTRWVNALLRMGCIPQYPEQMD